MNLLHGDCLERMKELPDKSIDLFVCDLPYGCLATGYRAPTCSWDIKIDLDQLWTQIKRLCRDDFTPVIMFCTTKFGYDLIHSNPDWFRYDLVWNKTRGKSFLLANKMPMRSHEMIYVFAKKGARYYRKDQEGVFPVRPATESSAAGCNTYRPSSSILKYSGSDGTSRCVVSVVDFPCPSKKGNHPTQKPEEIYRWLIERYSKEGDTILDPSAGSFTSVFTAYKLGRKAIGIEMNQEFYDKAVQSSSELLAHSASQIACK